MSTDLFEDHPAVRTAIPLLIGIMAPSGAGKTYSALRLATGIRRVTGGDIHVISTEGRRALHYAPEPGEAPDPGRGKFDFRHVAFPAPYGPLRYLAALEQSQKKGASIVIVDSLSHEHEGIGGVLDMHTQEIERLTRFEPDERAKARKAENVKMLAWAKPKADRQRLLNFLQQTTCNVICCFRAKEKIKLATKEERQRGEDAIQQLGWMPISDADFIYEMTVNALLEPMASGVPTWITQDPGSKKMLKIPEQFRKLLLEHKGPLDEKLGEAMALWAAGGSGVVPTGDELDQVLAALARAASVDEVERIAADNRGKRWVPEQRQRIRAAKIERTERLTPKGGP